MENQLDLFLNKHKKATSPVEEWDIFIDGAARGNPGLSGVGIFVTKKSDLSVLIKKGFFINHKTNNQAEYLALLLAIFLISEKQKELNLKKLILNINSDSELLVKQMLGIYKIKNKTLLQIKKIIDMLLINFSYNFVHILREKNKIADKLANLGIDKRISLPTSFLNFVASLNIKNDELLL